MTPHSWEQNHFISPAWPQTIHLVPHADIAEHWSFICRRCGHEIITLSEDYVLKTEDVEYWDCDEEIANKIQNE